MRLKSSLAGLALIALSGCASRKDFITDIDYTRTPVYNSTLDNPKSAELRQSTNQDSRYQLQRVVINGNDLYTINNENPAKEELKFRLIKYQDHIKEIDDSKETLRIVSNDSYIPKRVIISNEEITIFAKRINLNAEGEFGKKARIKLYETGNKETALINESEGNTIYNLRTIFLAGQEFYVPRVENEKINDQDSLPFYMMPVQGTTKIINANGEISLENKAGFYRPKKVSREELESRKKIKSGVDPTINDTTGQSGKIEIFSSYSS